ncbi:MAG: enoyl-CoA hydratase/isomerase family protein [Gammaproteobacteria bacterium]|jgi:enoyl-CoA hydratase/carnithine racemase|nr:enoyl-CoA hydratase/isomerase family protein [Gammaproteobacteria bacterium]MBT5602927.1 enoyl-CoA hydratase/isomerase family protein [Gammaproteobacteria bacterium]MBT6244336.1 enoyl-CoA hydratase/isomerase family protein [Gammaproteobacteria bacterium]
MPKPVLFSELELSGGNCAGVATLNSEATLNSLNLEMIDLLSAQLERWRTRSEVLFILIDSTGDRAFSAGGDIQSMYHDMKANPGGPSPYCDAFFEREYRLDYNLRNFSKPTIAWGHGIVMGGGLGILSACQFRIGTETTRIAMPEITIGLFPDAGATCTFSRMPSIWSHFIALTGANLNSKDGLMVGMISHLVTDKLKTRFVQELTQINCRTDLAPQITAILEDLSGHSEPFPDSLLEKHRELITDGMETALSAEDPNLELLQSMASWPEDKWLNRAKTSLQSGSPTTAAIIIEQFRRAKSMTMKEMFKMELTIAVNCSRHQDFQEGVRALLIEKDLKPDWTYAYGEVPEAHIQAHFKSPWISHPLDNLAD